MSGFQGKRVNGECRKWKLYLFRAILFLMFDFDPAKSAAHKAKRGIDFVEAQTLWDDRCLTEIRVVDYGGKERRLFVGAAGGKRWTAVVTRRGDRIRINSVRRARSSEEMAYDRRRI